MIANYLQAQIFSANNNETVAKNASKVHLIVNAADIKNIAGQTSLQKSLTKAFESKTSSVVVLHENQPSFFAAITKTDLESYRNAGAELFKTLAKEGIETASILNLTILSKAESYAYLEGFYLSSYKFTKYKKDKKKVSIALHVVETDFSKEELVKLEAVVRAVSLAKTLVSEPLSYLDALKFSEIAVETGKSHGFTTEIFHKEKIQELKMGGLLAVNQGSDVPPTFTIMEYKPENAINKKPLVLVGKGVMYDTGGYSLKVGGSMSSMKSDMGGGAAVLGTIAAVASSKLPYHVIGLVPATDNKIASNAIVVDDVITMMDGTTVEVQNTDAEGRLILGDALAYAKRFDPELVIDIATLTGAAAAITGSFGIAMATNTNSEASDLKVAGDTVYERVLELPLWDEFQDLLKSDIAEMKNIGGPTGGVSTAAKFLQHFTDYPWIHLDIAGAAFIKDGSGYRQNGATGVAIRLLYQFIHNKL